jgi:hypothetical protein
MMNPWFALSVQALRFGLQAQNTAFAGFMRLAEGPKDSAPETATEEPLLAEMVERPPAEIVAAKTASVRAATKLHKRTRRKVRMRR